MTRQRGREVSVTAPEPLPEVPTDGMDEGALIPGFTVGLSVLYLTTRGLLRRYREREARRLAALGDVIATKVRESIGGKP